MDKSSMRIDNSAGVPSFATNWDEPYQTVAQALNRFLAHYTNTFAESPPVSVATAYFNAGGFSLIADELEKTPRVRLLLGAEPDSEVLADLKIDESNVGLEMLITSHDAWLRRSRDMLGFTKESTHNAQRLVDWLRSVDETGHARVEVRRYEKGFLHGKAFIANHTSVPATLAGSANFTYAGLSRNAELVVGLSEASKVAYVEEWFDHFWDQSRPFDLAALYEDRWRDHTPHEIFLRMLHALYGSHLDDEKPGPTELSLAAFQADGVRRALRLLEENGGVIVADEVGLGKTFIAGEIMAQVSNQDRQKVLILCPAALRDGMWNKFLKKYDLSRRIDVMSYSEFRIRSKEDHDRFEEFLKELDDYALIVVDEAHNLRNAGSGQGRALEKLLGGKFPKKTLLLTATPVNNSLDDIETLIRYFVRNDAAFAGIGIPSIHGYIQAAKRMDPESLSPKHLFDLMDRVTVRRTRKFIKKNYANATVPGLDNKPIPIVFPETELERVNYVLTDGGRSLVDSMVYALSVKDDEELGSSYAERSSDPSRLMLARYTPSGYKVGENLEQYQINNAGLLRSLLLKRLESSPRALESTLEKLIASHEAFLRGMDDGYVITGRVLTEFMKSDSPDVEELLAQFGDDDRTADNLESLDLFHEAELRADVESDLTLLRSLLNAASEVAHGGDPKADKLVEHLRTIAQESLTVSSDSASETDRRKVIVFSTYTDTAHDLHEKVAARLAAEPDGTPLALYKGRLAPSVSGKASGRDSQDEVVSGFAPKTAGGENAADKYDIIITTDVLSEGVNLQQAGRIINYDLPWNPMRIVQRHGRIDRIGSEHSTVKIGIFWPDDVLNDLLQLEATLQRKLAYAAAAVGQDKVIPGQRVTSEVNMADKREIDERVSAEQKLIRDLFRGDHTVLERAESAISGEELRRRLSVAMEDRFTKDRVLSLPYGSGSGFSSDRAGSRSFVFCAKVKDHPEPRFVVVPVDESWAVRTDDDANVILSQETLIAISAADPGSDECARTLSDTAVEAAFDAWTAAQKVIHSSWNELSDPEKFRVDVPKIFQTASHLVMENPAGMSAEEVNELLGRLNTLPPVRVRNQVAAVIGNELLSAAEKQLGVRGVLEESGIRPNSNAEAFPPAELDEVRLVCWLAVDVS
jgi:hypothetical protein